ncbi:MAG: 26S proteasome regulatory subunit [Phylliscum demangeonii]|nr:MAG: 26S proteasome regulatory subunit [Phylliscum demangeonii]
MMDQDTIPDFLAQQREAAPAHLQTHFLSFEDFWERRLWHQLTEVLVAYFNDAASAPQRIAVYTTFVASFADKINQLQLVTLGLSAATQCRDDHERLTFLTAVADKVKEASEQEAYVYATAAVASIKLRLADLDGAQAGLATAEGLLDAFDTVDTVVHAAFYRVQADYHQARGEFGAYYRTALLYLACIAVSDLSAAEQQAQAYELAVAALGSDTIYNVGELLLHPILDALTTPTTPPTTMPNPHAWLRDLLFAFNAGDLPAFEQLARVGGPLDTIPRLAARRAFLHQKIRLAALTEMVFQRPPHDRALAFGAVAAATRLAADQVEPLVIKALSLGLVRGSIDQLAQLARLHWVQPKVLHPAQIAAMKARLQQWDASVNELGNWIERVGQDVWAS